MKSNHSILPEAGIFEQRPPLDTDYLKIEVHPASDDFRLFESLVNQGIDAHLEGFTLSEFGFRRYDSLGLRAYFNFHLSEIHLLIRRLEESPDADQRVASLIRDLENHAIEY